MRSQTWVVDDDHVRDGKGEQKGKFEAGERKRFQLPRGRACWVGWLRGTGDARFRHPEPPGSDSGRTHPAEIHGG